MGGDEALPTGGSPEQPAVVDNGDPAGTTAPKRWLTPWLACGAVVAAGIGGAVAGSAARPPEPRGWFALAPGWPQPDLRIAALVAHPPADAAVRSEVVVLSRNPGPGGWDVAWLADGGKACVGVLWPTDTVEEVSSVTSCPTKPLSAFATGTTSLMLMTARPHTHGNAIVTHAGEEDRYDLIGFVQGPVAGVDCLVGGQTFEGTLRTFAEAPGVSAFVITVPVAPGQAVGTFVVRARDAAGRVVAQKAVEG